MFNEIFFYVSVSIGLIFFFVLLRQKINKYIYKIYNFVYRNELKYKKKQFFFNKTERELMSLLYKIIDSKKYIIFAKPRLIDIFDIIGKDYVAKQKIISKHVDFLICTQGYYNPILGIELDGSSHNSTKRIIRDDFFDKVFEQGKLPLLRIKTYELKNTDSLKGKLYEKLSSLH